jgi:hypothetical protein
MTECMTYIQGMQQRPNLPGSACATGCSSLI